MIERNGLVYAVDPLPPLIRVRNVAPQPGYRLLLEFTNGERKIYDMSGKLDLPCYAPLKDEQAFYRAHIDGGTVVWPCGADVCPDTLYARGVPVESDANER